MFKLRVINLIILVTIFTFSAGNLFAMRNGSRSNILYGLGGAGKYDEKRGKFDYRKALIKDLPKLRKQQKGARDRLKLNPNDEDAMLQLKLSNQQIEFIKSELGGSWGDIILRSVAGTKNLAMVEDLTVGDKKLEGLYKGIAVRGGLSVGDAIGKSVDGYVGRIFDTSLGKIESMVSFIYRFLFKSSCKSFDRGELGDWKTIIVNDLKQIEVMIKNADKYESRNRSEVLREYESDDDNNSLQVNLWKDFIEDVARTCEDLAEEIDARKGYYKKKSEGFGIIQCAERLKNKLLKTKNWILNVNSLKEFVNTPEVKSVIPSMKKSFEYYFNNLAAQIKTVSYAKREFSSVSSKDKWASSMDDDMDDDFPGYMR